CSGTRAVVARPGPAGQDSGGSDAEGGLHARSPRHALLRAGLPLWRAAPERARALSRPPPRRRRGRGADYHGRRTIRVAVLAARGRSLRGSARALFAARLPPAVLRGPGAAGRLARRGRVPFVTSPRGMLDPGSIVQRAWRKRIAYRLIERRSLLDAAFLHATSEAEARAVRAWAPGAPVVTLPNGVEALPVPSTAGA